MFIKKLFYLIITGIGLLFSIPAAIMIIAYERGKAVADNIRAHMNNFNKKNK